jgi:PhnB protein
MAKNNPYIGFNGKCKDAMTFYQDCFGGELILQTFGESPIASQAPEIMKNKILHSMLSNGDFVLMGTDMTRPGENFSVGSDIAISVNFDKEEEINEVFKKLSKDGEILEELNDSFWGSLFGVVRDKYDKEWMLNYAKEADSSK